MGIKVLLGSLLACTVSSITLDAGYGVPSAPLLRQPPLAAPLPLQLLHTPPSHIPLQAIHPVFHSVPEPLVQTLPFAPQPLPFAPEQLPILPEQLNFAPNIINPVPIQAPSSQFHAQDEFGQFSFGYENINSAKTETKDAFGVTRGSYQYTDANGIVQTVNYIADDVNGFRVAGTNIPVAAAALPVAPLVPVGPVPVSVVETPEVAEARAAHLAAHEEAKEAATIERKKREDDDESSEPEPEPEADKKKKRSAEPIDSDYTIPAGPILHAAPVSISAPVVSHPLPLAHVSAPLQPAFLPVAQSIEISAAPLIPQHFAPEQFASLPQELRFAAPQPQIFAPSTFPQSLPFVPEQLPVAPHTLAPIQAPLNLAPQILGPAPLPTPIQAPSSQFHAQDEFGQFSFGYENINSAKTETKDAFGVTRGSYQYVDANGIVQTVHYTADDINGFRVSGTNIPVAPAGLPVGAPLLAPLSVKETPEVAAAREEHLAAHAEAKAAVDAANAESLSE